MFLDMLDLQLQSFHFALHAIALFLQLEHHIYVITLVKSFFSKTPNIGRPEMIRTQHKC